MFGVCGWKNSGKTTLAVGLVAELTRQGLRVATLKHAHHSFQIDTGETDSARHRVAGAGEVAIVSPQRWAMISEVAPQKDEPNFADVVTWFGPCDLILVEGYKSQPIPKIETRRKERVVAQPYETGLAETDPTVVAVASDHVIDAGLRPSVPVFALDDIVGIAGFVRSYLQLEVMAHETDGDGANLETHAVLAHGLGPKF